MEQKLLNQSKIDLSQKPDKPSPLISAVALTGYEAFAQQRPESPDR